MRTTYKMYRFCFYFHKPIPGIAEDGTYKTRCSCRSIRGAENYARKNAEIFSRSLFFPTKCVIEYNTTAGKQVREIEF